ncbi:coiled-coil domain-containing protein [Bartonella sp. AC134YNZD]|uniref:coiled-coil domain-containing protein n=1 Tax=Bartonella sp. AC134YNZD TaxID=3243446 RepID=UPI0035CEB29F
MYDRLYEESLRLRKYGLKYYGKCKTLEKEKVSLEEQLNDANCSITNLNSDKNKLLEKLEKKNLEIHDLQKENELLVDKAETHKKELSEAFASIEKLNTGTKKLNELLGVQRHSNDKLGIGYNGETKSNISPATGKVNFVKASTSSKKDYVFSKPKVDIFKQKEVKERACNNQRTNAYHQYVPFNHKSQAQQYQKSYNQSWSNKIYKHP